MNKAKKLFKQYLADKITCDEVAFLLDKDEDKVSDVLSEYECLYSRAELNGVDVLGGIVNMAASKLLSI